MLYFSDFTQFHFEWNYSKNARFNAMFHSKEMSKQYEAIMCSNSPWTGKSKQCAAACLLKVLGNTELLTCTLPLFKKFFFSSFYFPFCYTVIEYVIEELCLIHFILHYFKWNLQYIFSFLKWSTLFRSISLFLKKDNKNKTNAFI